MSIIKFIDSVCVQTAVYWGAPTADGYGGYTFADPVEIKVRWDDVVEVFTGSDGKEVISKAQVLTNHDCDEGGYLLLGSLPQGGNPRAEAWEIKRIDKTPLFKSTDEFVKLIYL